MISILICKDINMHTINIKIYQQHAHTENKQRLLPTDTGEGGEEKSYFSLSHIITEVSFTPTPTWKLVALPWKFPIQTVKLGYNTYSDTISTTMYINLNSNFSGLSIPYIVSRSLSESSFWRLDCNFHRGRNVSFSKATSQSSFDHFHLGDTSFNYRDSGRILFQALHYLPILSALSSYYFLARKWRSGNRFSIL